jgi:hypothetical protein
MLRHPRQRRHHTKVSFCFTKVAFAVAVPCSCRTIPRWQARELVPGDKLRPGAYKQQLRQREEAQLELVGIWGSTFQC